MLYAYFLCNVCIYAQDTGNDTIPLEKKSLGIGSGLDYGGLGLNVTIYPQRNIGLFGGIGYTASGLGYNGGMRFRFVPENKVEHFIPFLTLMYGFTNTVVVDKDAALDKIFYCASVGAGFDVRIHKKSKGLWAFAVIVPLNNSAVRNYIDDLKNIYGITKKDISPVQFSIGYRLLFHN